MQPLRLRGLIGALLVLGLFPPASAVAEKGSAHAPGSPRRLEADTQAAPRSPARRLARAARSSPGGDSNLAKSRLALLDLAGLSEIQSGVAASDDEESVYIEQLPVSDLDGDGEATSSSISTAPPAPTPR